MRVCCLFVVVVVVVTVVVDVVFVVVFVLDVVQVHFKVYMRLLEMEVEFWWVCWDGGLRWAKSGKSPFLVASVAGIFN